MRKFLSDNFVIIVIGIFFLVSTILAIRNNQIIQNNLTLQLQSDMVKQRTTDILSRTMHGLDLGVRGFGLTLDDKMLIPYREAIATNPRTFYQLDSLLQQQGYDQRSQLGAVKAEVDQYISFCNSMIAKAREGDTAAFIAMLNEDRGYNVWFKYIQVATPLFEFETTLNKQSMEDYKRAMQVNLFLQIASFVLGLPLLVVFVSRVKRERNQRHKLVKEVELTDKKFVFNDGDSKEKSAEEINQQAIENVRYASEFIRSIASGNYDVEWRNITADVMELNKSTLAGNLLNLKERLKEIKREDERRNWVNEGLAKFSEIVRSNQSNFEELAVKCVSFLSKYTNAQQGSLFLLEEEDGRRYLRLASCYAYEKRKFIEKKIDLGVGLTGQAFLEGEPMLLKQIPQGYTTITSGLGDATPTFLAIVPMKADEQVVAIIELATFYDVEQYQVEFLQKAGGYFASAMVTTQTTSKMKRLLDESSIKEQQMIEREEELRQNMEELKATQEELIRKQNEYERDTRSVAR
jgi:CHASE3 domain sensor protein